MLGGLTGFPQGTFASKVTISNEQAFITREIDGGLQTLALKLPAIVTTDLRLNEPRYTKLPDIMKAKRKPLAVTTPTDLGIEVTTSQIVLRVENPPLRQTGSLLRSKVGGPLQGRGAPPWGGCGQASKAVRNGPSA